MSFYQKYELARLIADGETKTFRAIEIATGQTVLFHFFNSESHALLAALRAKLEPRPGKPERPLLEVGEFAGNPYAVTEMIEPFTNFGDWLAVIEVNEKGGSDQQKARPPRIVEPRISPAAGIGEPANVPAPPSPYLTAQTSARPPDNAGAQPGEFTRFFDNSSALPSAPAQGDFTRWFDSPPATLNAEALSKPEARHSPSQPQQHDEFTKLFERAPPTDEFEKLFGGSAPSKPFQAPADKPLRDAADPGESRNPYARNPFEDTLPRAAPSANAPNVRPDGRDRPTWPTNSPPSEDTGQFTKLFGSGPSGEAIDIEGEQARAAQSAQPEGRPFQAASEFTRVFGPQGIGNVPNPPPTKMSLQSGIFGSAQKLNAALPEKSGPGEYTRMTTLAELEAEHTALQQANALEIAPAGKWRPNGLIIGLAIGGIVLIIAIIVVLVMMSQKH